jgi:hypothetical protein
MTRCQLRSLVNICISSFEQFFLPFISYMVVLLFQCCASAVAIGCGAWASIHALEPTRSYGCPMLCSARFSVPKAASTFNRKSV